MTLPLPVEIAKLVFMLAMLAGVTAIFVGMMFEYLAHLALRSAYRLKAAEIRFTANIAAWEMDVTAAWIAGEGADYQKRCWLGRFIDGRMGDIRQARFLRFGCRLGLRMLRAS